MGSTHAQYHLDSFRSQHSPHSCAVVYGPSACSPIFVTVRTIGVRIQWMLRQNESTRWYCVCVEPVLLRSTTVEYLGKLCGCPRTPLMKKNASCEQCMDHRGTWVAKVYFGLKGKSKSSLQCNPAIKQVLERARESTHGWRRSDDRRKS